MDIVTARHVTSRLETYHRYVHKSDKVALYEPADNIDTARDKAHGVSPGNSTAAATGHIRNGRLQTAGRAPSLCGKDLTYDNLIYIALGRRSVADSGLPILSYWNSVRHCMHTVAVCSTHTTAVAYR